MTSYIGVNIAKRTFTAAVKTKKELAQRGLKMNRRDTNRCCSGSGNWQKKASTVLLPHTIFPVPCSLIPGVKKLPWLILVMFMISLRLWVIKIKPIYLMRKYLLISERSNNLLIGNHLLKR